MVESALGSAMNTWYYGRGDLFDVAAAYAYHLAESQAFLDGNKRTAVAAALAFLARNGGPLLEDNGDIYQAMIATANHQLDKPGLAAIFRRLAAK
jgi:death on curing protein